MQRNRKLVRVCLAMLVAALLVACSSIPTDPENTLNRVRGEQVLRAGASPAEGWIEVDGDDVTGRESDLVEAFAESLGATVEWHIEGEQHLVEGLELGRLDLAVGGFTADTPWVSKTGVTRGYTTSLDATGQQRQHVMLVPIGENAFLSELERFLDERGGDG